MTLQQLQDKTGVNVARDNTLAASFMKNPKVRCAGALLHYHAQHSEVKTQAQLLALLDKTPDGIYLNELKDAYKQCVSDLRVRPPLPLPFFEPHHHQPPASHRVTAW